MPNIRYAAVSQLAGRLPVKMSSWLAPADLEMTLYDPKRHTIMSWQTFDHWHNGYQWGAPDRNQTISSLLSLKSCLVHKTMSGPVFGRVGLLGCS